MLRSLSRYREMRDFGATPEPAGRASSATQPRPVADEEAGIYVVQKHDASRLHYDFRIALDGALLSWAVPKGPSTSIGVRRLAVRTEDHPLEYATFHGDIPEGHYGAGHVEIWDHGTWTPVGDANEGLASGHLKFDLHGERLKGRFVLVRMKSGGGDRSENWLLIRERPKEAATPRAARTRASRATPSAARKDRGNEAPGTTKRSGRGATRRKNGGGDGNGS